MVSPARWQVPFLISVLCLIWGSTWIVIKRGLEDMPPFTAAAIRFAMAGLVMTLIAPFASRREGGSKPPPRLTLVMGVCTFFLSYSVVYWSQQYLPSGLESVLWAVCPLMVVGLSTFCCQPSAWPGVSGSASSVRSSAYPSCSQPT